MTIDYSSLLESFLAYVLVYKYSTLFVAIFLAGVGFPVPQNAIVLATGAFASQGTFNFVFSLLVIVIANVLGDSFGYWLLRKYGSRILQKNYHNRFSFLRRLKTYVDPLTAYIKKHEEGAVFFTRFFSPANTVVNFLAGYLEIPFAKFLLADVVGNFTNTIVVLLLGFYINQSWEGIAGILDVAGLFISMVIIVGVILILRQFRKNNRTDE